MKAILLATGENQKLPALSSGASALPLPLLPVANRPVMLHAIDMLARQNIRHMLVSLHQQAGAIELYFGGGERWGVNLEYMLQRDAWGTAGALAWARKYLTEPFLVLPADILIDLDVSKLLQEHILSGSAATIVAHVAGPYARQGSADGLHSPAARSLAPVPHGWRSTGVYLFDPCVLDFIPERTPFDIEQQLIPALLRSDLTVRAHKMHGYWNALESLIDFQNAQAAFLHSDPAVSPNSQEREPAKWLTPMQNRAGRSWFQFLHINHRQASEGIWIGRGSAVHPTARITAPVYIGENCRIGREVELGPYSVLGPNVIVDDQATVTHSTVLAHTYIGRLVNVQNRIVNQQHVIDIASGTQLEVPDAFLLGSTHRSVDDSLLVRGFEALTALLVLLLSLPVTLPVSLTLLLTQRKVFERLPRLKSTGSGGQAAFSLLRFHSARPQERETVLSRLLENWMIKRLPELWNVVRGELRLVGVQALLPETASAASDGIEQPWQQPARSSKPGFTGLWFVQSQAVEDAPDLLVDAYYTAIRDWKTDLKILKQTPAAWLRKVKAARQQAQARNMGMQAAEVKLQEQ